MKNKGFKYYLCILFIIIVCIPVAVVASIIYIGLRIGIIVSNAIFSFLNYISNKKDKYQNGGIINE